MGERGRTTRAALLVLGAWGALCSSLACDATPAHDAAGPASTQAVAARSVEQATASERVRGDFTGHQAVVSARNAAASFSLAAAGCWGDARPLPRSIRKMVGALVEYRYPGIREWYTLSARGIEQGFTVEQSPCGGGDLQLDVSVAGLTVKPSAHGAGVDLLDRAGSTVMHYTDLSARDARGQTLASTLSVERGLIALRVASQGAAFPIVIDPEVWAEVGNALSGTADGSLDRFGYSVAISRGAVLVGAPSETVAEHFSQGAGHVFTWDGQTWLPQGPLLVASDGASYDAFGSSVSLSGDTAVLGAPGKTTGTNATPGAAYVFIREGSTWKQQGPALSASDGDVGDEFGASVGVAGDTVVVGAPGRGDGAAYVFVRDGEQWTQQGPALTGTQDFANSRMGNALSISGETVLIGSSDKNTKAGAAWVFVRSGDAWAEQGYLTATDAAANDAFGTSVALDGDVALIGAPKKTVGTHRLQGATYVFTRAGTKWTQQAQVLTSDDGADNDAFGSAVSVWGDSAIIGAMNKTVASRARSGVAYTFALSGTTWQQQGAAFSSANGAAEGQFGGAVAVFEDALAVGAINQNAAYVYARPCASAGDCAKDHVCIAGSCGEVKGLGQKCQDAGECASGFCADEVCCEKACDGQCEACAEAGSEGACSAVKGAPRGTRDACAGDGKDCGGTCDGRDVTQCQYEAAETSCGQVCTEGQSVTGSCDGKGVCVAESPVSCGDYACGEMGCLRECHSERDCAYLDDYCELGECVRTKCSSDGRFVVRKSLSPLDCAPYACDTSSGKCGGACSNDSDCSDGNRCNSNADCAPAEPDSGGGGCTLGRRSASSGASAALGLLLLLALRRTRRSAR